tara:strand:+ start:7663 stop:7878 length:216 start_codon:yes stop_codon:yes gene_type:complete
MSKKKNSFETAYHQYACYLHDILGQAAWRYEYICPQLSGPDSTGAYILRGVSENEIARVNGKQVTLAPFNY